MGAHVARYKKESYSPIREVIFLKNFDAYLIFVEPAGDYFFSPEGVCIVDEDRNYKLYSLDSRHNFLRSAILKFSLTDLIGDGVAYKGTSLRLEDLQLFREKNNLLTSSVTSLLRAIYMENPLQHHYLRRFL